LQGVQQFKGQGHKVTVFQFKNGQSHYKYRICYRVCLILVDI